MTLTVHNDLIQGTDAWMDVRRGIVTASAVGQLISARQLGASDYDCPACGAAAVTPCRSKVKKAGDIGAPIKTFHPERHDYAAAQDAPPVLTPARNDVARNLTLVLTAERITGWTDPTYMSDDMWRGIEDEPVARDAYSEHYAPATEIGFMTEDKWGFTIGYSPDGLVGADGLIEVKSRRSKTQLTTIIGDTVPAENMAQLQCGLLVSGRKWIDYISYTAGMPLYVKRVLPDQRWFDAIIAAVTQFEHDAAELTATYERAITGLHPTERTNDLGLAI